MSKSFQPMRRPRRGRRQAPVEDGGSHRFFGFYFGFGPLFLSFLSMVGLLWFLMDLRVRPAIAAAEQTVAQRAATQALNQALETAIASSPDDNQILHVETDNNGVLRLASFDFRTVSQIEAMATDKADSSMEGLSRVTLPMPISQSLGGALLTMMGPDVPVRIRLVGSAHTSIRMDVHSVGINQTVHALYLDLTAQVRAVSPLVSTPVEVHSSVPVAYVVLNGQIPNTYVGKDSKDGAGSDTGVLVLGPKQ